MPSLFLILFSFPFLSWKKFPFPSLCQIENFYYSLFACDLSSSPLHFCSPLMDFHPLGVLLPCYEMHCFFLFIYFFIYFFQIKKKSRLSYPWPDLLLWLMAHILLPFLTEVMELVICSCWLALLARLAASPCPSPEGLLPAPPLTSCSPHSRVNAPLPGTYQLPSTAHFS